jgi:hypothetical protein
MRVLYLIKVDNSIVIELTVVLLSLPSIIETLYQFIYLDMA